MTRRPRRYAVSHRRAMLAASVAARETSAAQPLGFLLGVIAFAVCTWGSLRWERIYRAQLAGGAGR